MKQIFVCTFLRSKIWLGLYVDDGLIAGSTLEELNDLIDKLKISPRQQNIFRIKN